MPLLYEKILELFLFAVDTLIKENNKDQLAKFSAAIKESTNKLKAAVANDRLEEKKILAGGGKKKTG